LTETGKDQAHRAGEGLCKLIENGIAKAPTEAMVSPLCRCLETASIILKTEQVANITTHIRSELRERQTQYPPDKPRPLDRSRLLLFTKNGEHKFVTEDQGTIKDHELTVEESRAMLRQRANKLFDLLLDMDHLHIMIVSHKGYLRELERGLLQIEDSKLFGNGEIRIYRVNFTHGDRKLASVERLA